MYINLILGIFFCCLVWFIIKYFMGEMRSPRSILLEELEDRKLRDKLVQENVERLRDTAIARMRPIVAAVADMNAVLLQTQQFVLEDDEDVLNIRLRETTITVRYTLQSFSVDGSEDDFAEDVARFEQYVIDCYSGDGTLYSSRSAVTEQEAVRLIAREIAAILE